jgi:hypothetical protein
MSEAKTATRLPMITSARVGFSKSAVQEKVLAEKKKVHPLFHVVGTATQAIVKESKDYEDKESIEFRGSFLAINVETGEQFKSGKLYLPSVVEAEFAAAVQQSGMIEIAVTVVAEYAEKAATSYTYNIKSFGKEDNSAFDKLLSLIPGAAKLLPAPEKEAPKAGAKK